MMSASEREQSSTAGCRLHRLHGGRQVDGPRGRARGGAGDHRGRCAYGVRARRADRRGLRARRRGGLPRPRGGGGGRAARGGRGGRDRARRRQHPLRAGPRRPRSPHGRLAGGRCRGGLAAYRPLRATAGAVGRRRRRPSRGPPAALRGARRRGRPGPRPRGPHPRPALDPGARGAARGDEAALGLEPLGRVPRLRRRRDCSARAGGRRRAAAFSSATKTSPPATPRAPSRSPPGSRSSRARARRRWPGRSGSCASWPRRA